MPPIEVVLYALSTCPWCRKTKSFFEDRGVPYVCFDVDKLRRKERNAVKDKVTELAGALAYPVVVINGAVVQGYNPGKFADLLEEAGWTTEE